MKPASLWLVTLLFATCAAAQTNSAAQRRAAADSFGNEIARAFNERDSKALNSLIDLHALAARGAVPGIGPDAEQAFVRGAELKGLQPLIAPTPRPRHQQGHGQVHARDDPDTAAQPARFDPAHRDSTAEYVLHTDATGRTRGRLAS
jgi:hypothetical protein